MQQAAFGGLVDIIIQASKHTLSKNVAQRVRSWHTAAAKTRRRISVVRELQWGLEIRLEEGTPLVGYTQELEYCEDGVMRQKRVP